MTQAMVQSFRGSNSPVVHVQSSHELATASGNLLRSRDRYLLPLRAAVP